MNGSSSLDADLAVRLRVLAGRVPPAEISDLWIFPPLAAVADSREFVLFTRMLPDGMRRVCGAELPSPASSVGPAPGNGAPAGPGPGDDAASVREYGRIPSGRVARVVDGFRRRLGDAVEPIHLRIEGCADAWDRALARDAYSRHDGTEP